MNRDDRVLAFIRLTATRLSDCHESIAFLTT
jgi:hypothetical protein